MKEVEEDVRGEEVDKDGQGAEAGEERVGNEQRIVERNEDMEGQTREQTPRPREQSDGCQRGGEGLAVGGLCEKGEEIKKHNLVVTK